MTVMQVKYMGLCGNLSKYYHAFKIYFSVALVSLLLNVNQCLLILNCIDKKIIDFSFIDCHQLTKDDSIELH